MESGRADKALGCIVVKAPEVLQSRLVAELVLVLRGGGEGWASVSAAPALKPPRAARGPQSSLRLRWAPPPHPPPHLFLRTRPLGHPLRHPPGGWQTATPALSPQRRESLEDTGFSFAFNFLSFLAVPHGMWDLSSLTRDPTHIPCIGSAVLTTGPPRKSLEDTVKMSHVNSMAGSPSPL